MKTLDVAIVGAGPYGLSVAAHLKDSGIDHCVFGPVMSFWHQNMPPGTKLKSDGSSSDLPAPHGGFPIGRHQTETTSHFAPTQPITVQEFHAYGTKFCDRMVSHADPRAVSMISRHGTAFSLTLSDGDIINARAVVIAVGVRAFAHLPRLLAALPSDRVTHSVTHGPVAMFAGKRVAVIGSGASAIDVAAALHEAGADTRIITRRQSVAFHHPPAKRPLRHRIRRPDSGIGGGWDLWFYANYPFLFHALPEALRLRIVDRTLGPAPGWFMRERIEGKVPILTGMALSAASVDAGAVMLDLKNHAGLSQRIAVDHVVAATGFRPDVARLAMLDTSLIAAIKTVDAAPVLSRRFETTVPGLYMIGPIAAPSFGPVMRFVFGAGRTTPVLGQHLAAQRQGKAASVLRPVNADIAYGQAGE